MNCDVTIEARIHLFTRGSQCLPQKAIGAYYVDQCWQHLVSGMIVFKLGLVVVLVVCRL